MFSFLFLLLFIGVLRLEKKSIFLLRYLWMGYMRITHIIMYAWW